MADNRITKERLKNHWAYSWWKYLAMTAATLMLVSLLFTMTAYRPPADRQVELMLCGMNADTARLQAELLAQLQPIAPDQEAVSASNLALGLGFLVRTSAEQGDLYWMPAAEMAKLADGGAWRIFADLSPYIADGTIDAAEVELMRYPDESGEEAIYAVATDGLSGLAAYGLDVEGGALCVMAYSANQQNAARVLALLLDMGT